MAFGSSVLTHKKEQQIKIEGEFKPTVDSQQFQGAGRESLPAERRGTASDHVRNLSSGGTAEVRFQL